MLTSSPLSTLLRISLGLLMAATVTPDLAAQANQEQRLVSSDLAQDDRFGHDVAIETTRLIAGAPGQDAVAADAGAAYLFDFDSGSQQWVESQKLTASDGAADDAFGCAVAVSGDRAAIGASGQDGTGSDEGSVYLFERNSGTGVWAESVQLTAPSPAAGDLFGSTLLLEGDLLVVGAPSTTGIGTVHVFRYDSGSTSWLHQAALQASDASAGDLFGSSLAVAGDRLAVGAPGHGSGEGALYLFDYDSGTTSWSEIALLEASDKGSSPTPAQLGASVDLVGDQLVGGANGYTVGAKVSAGKAYLFERDGGTGLWSETQALLPQNSWSGGGFGNDVRINAEKIQIGNPFAGNVAEGIVHGQIWHPVDQAYRQVEEWTSLHTITDDSSFGFCLDTATDGKLLIGAPTEASAPGDQPGGSVYLYFFPAFELSITPNQAGVVNTVSCVGAIPRSRVAFVYGTAPGFYSLQTFCPGIGFNIQQPTLIDLVNVDGVGEASASQMVPGTASGFQVLLQGFDFRGCRVSPVLTTTLQ